MPVDYHCDFQYNIYSALIITLPVVGGLLCASQHNPRTSCHQTASATLVVFLFSVGPGVYIRGGASKNKPIDTVVLSYAIRLVDVYGDLR